MSQHRKITSFAHFRISSLGFLVASACLIPVEERSSMVAQDGGAQDGGGNADAGANRIDPGITPAAPAAELFQWQGQQIHFNGTTCRGRIAMAVGGPAVCYVHQDGAMRCAGHIYQTTYGPGFKKTDRGDVDQIFVSPEAGPHQGLCIHTRDAGAACIGDYNQDAQYATGTSTGSSAYRPWGDGVALATGNWHQFCSLLQTGQFTCAGNTDRYNHISLPLIYGQSTQARLYVTTAGRPVPDSPSVFRASGGLADCLVTARGLECEWPPDAGTTTIAGTPGQVVDGFQFEQPRVAGGVLRCWLESTGVVTCNAGRRFSTGTVLAVSANAQTKTACAVYNDGSLWCFGSTNDGKLGIPPSPAVVEETMVQPPGSVLIGCP